MQGTQNGQNNLEKKEQRGFIYPNFKRYHYKATAIKVLWNWHVDKNLEQRNRTESPELNPQLIFNKDAKTTNWAKNNPFNKPCWDN